jgi:cysteine desulfurase
VLVVPERTRWRRGGPVSEVEGRRTDAEPVVALAWPPRSLAADRGDPRRRARRLAGRPDQGGRDGDPRHRVVGDQRDRLPHVVTFSCLYVDGEALVTELDRRGFAVASGSACTSMLSRATSSPRWVLTHGNVRVTLPLEGVALDRGPTSSGSWQCCRRGGRGAGPARGGRAVTAVEVRGLRCPLPVIRLAQRHAGRHGHRDHRAGHGPAARHDVPAWCRMPARAA